MSKQLKVVVNPLFNKRSLKKHSPHRFSYICQTVLGTRRDPQLQNNTIEALRMCTVVGNFLLCNSYNKGPPH